MAAATERLYYTDAFLTAFDATVAGSVHVGGRPAVVLDRTAFYPTSGGQPFDTGTLEGIRVEDVVELEDGRVAHVLERPLPAGAAVHGIVDWTRRFDHMQQHTGQHVLSAALEHAVGAATVSFHLGASASTIDVALPLTAAQIEAGEEAANRVVWEDRPVAVRFVSAEEAASLPLRKETKRTGTLRLVEIEGFDLSACGGTHVPRTGAIGMIAVSAFERFKGGMRIEFVCGHRALQRFRSLRDIVSGAVRTLSVLPAEVPAGIERLQTELKEERQGARALQARLVTFEAARMIGNATPAGTVPLVAEVVETSDPQQLKNLASAVTASGSVACVFVTVGAPYAVVVAAAPGVKVDAAELVKSLTARFGGRGGGRSVLAQAGGLTGTAEDILLFAREEIARARADARQQRAGTAT